jgi:hypothetical protein
MDSLPLPRLVACRHISRKWTATFTRTFLRFSPKNETQKEKGTTLEGLCLVVATCKLAVVREQ